MRFSYGASITIPKKKSVKKFEVRKHIELVMKASSEALEKNWPNGEMMNGIFSVVDRGAYHVTNT